MKKIVLQDIRPEKKGKGKNGYAVVITGSGISEKKVCICYGLLARDNGKLCHINAIDMANRITDSLRLLNAMENINDRTTKAQLLNIIRKHTT